MQAINETNSRSFSDAASSITARWRPEYSRIMASCTMVELEVGSRIVDGDAGVLGDRDDDQAISARPSEIRRPTCGSRA